MKEKLTKMKRARVHRIQIEFGFSTLRANQRSSFRKSLTSSMKITKNKTTRMPATSKLFKSKNMPNSKTNTKKKAQSNSHLPERKAPPQTAPGKNSKKIQISEYHY